MNRIQPDFRQFEQLSSFNDSISHHYRLDRLNHRDFNYLPPITPLSFDQSFYKTTANRPLVSIYEKTELKTSVENSLERLSTAEIKRRLAALKNKRNY